MPRHVRKGDTVMVTSGSYKGQTGQILRVIPDDDRVVVKGINLKTKDLKPSRINPQGGVITREEPIHISKVSPVIDGKPTRVGFRVNPDGSKVRVATKKFGSKELGVVRRATSERRTKKI